MAPAAFSPPKRFVPVGVFNFKDKGRREGEFLGGQQRGQLTEQHTTLPTHRVLHEFFSYFILAAGPRRGTLLQVGLLSMNDFNQQRLAAAAAAGWRR